MAQSRSNVPLPESWQPLVKKGAMVLGVVALLATASSRYLLSSSTPIGTDPAYASHSLKTSVRHTERIVVKGGSLVETVTVTEEAHYTKE